MSKKSSNVLNLKSIFKKNKKISEIYSNFKFRLEKTTNKKKFIVGVSGGPDSLALAALSKMYQHENKVKVFFVLIETNSCQSVHAKSMLKRELQNFA